MPVTSGDSYARGSSGASISHFVEHRRPTSRACRRRTAACPTRPRRRWPSRRSGETARSPSAAGPTARAATARARASRTHSSFGSVKPVSAGFSVSSISRARADALGDLAAFARRSADRTRAAPAARPRPARRAATSRASGRRSRRPRSSPRRRPACATTARTASLVARHQSRGSCSAQPVCGDANGT